MIIEIVDTHMSFPRMINRKETNKRIFLSEQTLIILWLVNVHTIYIIRISAKCGMDQENMRVLVCQQPPCQFRLLHPKRIGGNAKDGQGCHHLPSSPLLKQGQCRHLPLHTQAPCLCIQRLPNSPQDSDPTDRQVMNWAHLAVWWTTIPNLALIFII